MKFSIIIPVYNVAPYLRECLDSVLAQTYPDWEAICVDDGSTDASGTILDEYAAKDTRFKVVRQENAGVSVARNRGMSRATGEIIYFVDSDDFVAENLLEEVHRLFEKEHPDLVRIGYCRYQGFEVSRQSDCSYLVLDGRERIAEWAAQTLPQEGSSCLNFIKRECLERKFAEGVQIGEDMLFMMAVARQADRIVQTRFVGYFYRDNPCSATRRRFSSEERVRFFAELKNLAKSYQGGGGTLSFAAWFNLMSWIVRPKDETFRKELHKAFSELVATGLIDLTAYPHYARLCCRIYLRTGLLWPVRCVYSFVSCAVKVRDSLLRRRVNVMKVGRR